jgi:uronate dehydrogenase
MSGSEVPSTVPLMTAQSVIITGAGGRIGRVLRDGLAGRVGRLLLIDRVDLQSRHPNETACRLDISDARGLGTLFAGADAVIHLAGLADEASLPDLLAANVLGSAGVLEAARRSAVRRVILASSNRVTSFHSTVDTVGPSDPVRPDGLYAVSKVAVEALGRLYADKFGLEVVCLRFGSFEPEPAEARHLATWLSPRDCVGFVAAALVASPVSFLTTYAVSNNRRRFWSDAGWRELGYQPVDDAESFARRFTAGSEPVCDRQGGRYTDPSVTLRVLDPP